MMTLQEMALLAKQHWKAVNPRIYQAMVDRGELESEAAAVARLTQREMEVQMAVGATEAEAWEATREIFIITDPAKEYQPEEDEAPEDQLEDLLVELIRQHQKEPLEGWTLAEAVDLLQGGSLSPSEPGNQPDNSGPNADAGSSGNGQSGRSDGRGGESQPRGEEGADAGGLPPGVSDAEQRIGGRATIRYPEESETLSPEEVPQDEESST